MVNINSVNNTQNYNNAGGLTPPSQLYGKESKNTAFKGSDKFSLAGGKSNDLVTDISQYGIGALSAYKYNQTFVGATQDFGSSLKSGSFRDVLGSAKVNGKLLGGATVNAIGIGALLSGGVSAVTNTVKVFQGKESFGDAVGNVTKSSLRGAISSTGGMFGGGVTALALGAFKVGGVPLTVATVIGGAVTSAIVDNTVNKKLGLH